MMFTTPMTQLFAVVLGKDRQAVTEVLLSEGVMQFIRISEFEADKPDGWASVQPETALSDISDLRKRVEGVLHTIGVIPVAPEQTDLERRVPVNFDKESKRLDLLDRERESIRERQRALNQEILKLEDLKRQMQVYNVNLANVSLPSHQSLLSLQTGSLPVGQISKLEDALKELPALNIVLGQDDKTAHVLLISIKRDRAQIEKIVANTDWSKVELPQELLSNKKDLSGELSAKLKTFTDEQKKLQKKVDDLVGKDKERLGELWRNLRLHELCTRIQINFQSSPRTLIFAGWLPASKKEVLAEKITQASAGRCYLEWQDAGDKETIKAEVPIQFNNPKVLAPFQMLVSNFGIPEYGTIDPTPFVMPLYLAMFGLMFADAGQGLVLAGLGLLGLRKFREQEAKKGLYQLSWLILWCGCAAILFGILLGSYFGKSWIKPLWFDFHGIVTGHGGGDSVISDIYDVLAITIYFGIAVIALGLFFNWVNLVRTRRWAELLFDKGGLLGGWMYAGGIYIASYMIAHDYKGFPSGMHLFLLAGLPGLLLFIKEPYHHFQHQRSHPDEKARLAAKIPEFLMEWVVELLEIFSGYLSNTLSFMRVAGLGIAHVCLMMSFFTLADMTSGVFSILILVLGNVLVIGLEGLSAGIQALRLNYYEFFTKFFHGTGKLYAPISLTSET
jgi:V/A-type H+/Na+-transporting ATPase subunit I